MTLRRFSQIDGILGSTPGHSFPIATAPRTTGPESDGESEDPFELSDPSSWNLRRGFHSRHVISFSNSRRHELIDGDTRTAGNSYPPAPRPARGTPSGREARAQVIPKGQGGRPSVTLKQSGASEVLGAGNYFEDIGLPVQLLSNAALGAQVLSGLTRRKLSTPLHIIDVTDASRGTGQGKPMTIFRCGCCSDSCRLGDLAKLSSEKMCRCK
jgi:hypothetical protein